MVSLKETGIGKLRLKVWEQLANISSPSNVWRRWYMSVARFTEQPGI